MLILLSALAAADPVPLDLTPPPLPRAAPGAMLLADLLVGLGQSASPYTITGPTQSLSTADGWQCLGVDNATLDVASRCQFVGMTRRAERTAP